MEFKQILIYNRSTWTNSIADSILLTEKRTVRQYYPNWIQHRWALTHKGLGVRSAMAVSESACGESFKTLRRKGQKGEMKLVSARFRTDRPLCSTLCQKTCVNQTMMSPSLSLPLQLYSLWWLNQRGAVFPWPLQKRLSVHNRREDTHTTIPNIHTYNHSAWMEWVFCFKSKPGPK